MIKFFLFILILLLNNFNLFAEIKGPVTDLDLPRYVTLKSNNVNLRIGSSINFPILLTYNAKNLPVEIHDEYDVWRKIRDIDGNEGWIHKSLLKGERYGIVVQNNNHTAAKIFSSPKGNVIGEIGELNIIKINTCLDYWCKIQYKKFSGWVNKKNIWGVYKNEKINVPFYQSIINFFWKI